MSKFPDFLLDLLTKQYGTELTNKIIEGYSAKRKVTLRVNTIKSTNYEIEEELINADISFKRIEWYNNAYILENTVEENIRSLKIYENGKIYMQSLSSMIPPIILEPKPKESILDMAAAPGGKTTQIAMMTENKAFITACEINKIRADRLRYNIEKQGAKGIYVMTTDSRKLDNMFSFDKILLDAPCSGSGIINEKTDFNKTFTKELINKCVKTQVELLSKALKILKPGGEIVYSTCSILEKENEEVLNKVLSKENATIIPIKELQEIQYLPSKIKGTICVCPSKEYEGFFVAKIRKNT